MRGPTAALPGGLPRLRLHRSVIPSAALSPGPLHCCQLALGSCSSAHCFAQIPAMLLCPTEAVKLACSSSCLQDGNCTMHCHITVIFQGCHVASSCGQAQLLDCLHLQPSGAGWLRQMVDTENLSCLADCQAYAPLVGAILRNLAAACAPASADENMWCL